MAFLWCDVTKICLVGVSASVLRTRLHNARKSTYVCIIYMPAILIRQTDKQKLRLSPVLLIVCVCVRVCVCVCVCASVCV